MKKVLWWPQHTSFLFGSEMEGENGGYYGDVFKVHMKIFVDKKFILIHRKKKNSEMNGNR